MYAAALNSAAIVSSAPVTAAAPSSLAANAANDAMPTKSERATVTLPTHLSLRGRRDRPVSVDISRDAVTIRPHSGEAAAATRPLSSYRGVAVTVERGEGEPVFHLSLMHEEHEHSVLLSSGTEVATVAREWQAWAKALSLPLLAVEADGRVHAELTALGVVLAERPSERRKGSALVGRRSLYGRRRRAAPLARSFKEMNVIAGEREIIART
ncbi:DUF6101 family protein [Acuticoccus sp. M5D2P5]|uniref:DUF6101 family protein n=1 Tax=Acuticoccus kalidii TaxID=2910977 RepID=UPI001F481793|nr:DUF6101 family protein [Acuticoccus kalidii]MCF3933465.1 DUF6101 family protein [Acuticoccus kalidii]